MKGNWKEDIYKYICYNLNYLKYHYLTALNFDHYLASGGELKSWSGEKKNLWKSVRADDLSVSDLCSLP